MEKVFLVKTRNRAEAVSKLLVHFDLRDFKGKRICLKANYNSADAFPASTHLDTLKAIVKELTNAGAADITLAERSGMGVTREVLAETGVLKLSEQLDFKVVDLDELDEKRWVPFSSPNLHWQRGFWIAKAVKEADKVVQTCCLKTHRFGGHFTLSLKNSVGLIAKYGPKKDGYNFMGELHSSPHQRYMIAEINLAYKPDVVIMDGFEAFVKGGPEDGDKVNPGVMLAGRDGVAIDAIGVAILRHFGTTPEVSQGRIFEQQQIARAAELGIGVKSASDIELVPLDAESQKIAQDINAILQNEG